MHLRKSRSFDNLDIIQFKPTVRKISWTVNACLVQKYRTSSTRDADVIISFHLRLNQKSTIFNSIIPHCWSKRLFSFCLNVLRHFSCWCNYDFSNWRNWKIHRKVSLIYDLCSFFDGPCYNRCIKLAKVIIWLVNSYNYSIMGRWRTNKGNEMKPI